MKSSLWALKLNYWSEIRLEDRWNTTKSKHVLTSVAVGKVNLANLKSPKLNKIAMKTRRSRGRHTRTAVLVKSSALYGAVKYG